MRFLKIAGLFAAFVVLPIGAAVGGFVLHDGLVAFRGAIQGAFGPQCRPAVPPRAKKADLLFSQPTRGGSIDCWHIEDAGRHVYFIDRHGMRVVPVIPGDSPVSAVESP